MSDERIRTAFRDQARACTALGSGFTAHLCERLADLLKQGGGKVATRILNWPGDPSGRADSVPLRLCGAMHALVLTGNDRALAEAYRARRVEDAAILGALHRHEDEILRWLDSPPQTNEVARSAAIILAARFAAGHVQLPIRALELGASAGLNLNFHRYDLRPIGAQASAARATSWNISREDDAVLLEPEFYGNPPDTPFTVGDAEGVDLRPVDPVADGLRLMAYCWADQDARLARLRAALAIAQRHPPRVTAGDAGDWLADRLAQPVHGRLTLVYHTIAAQYFPPATLAACNDALERAAAGATPEAPVAHFAMEADDGNEGAGLALKLWDGAAHGWNLGRADFHGRWIDWKPNTI